MARNLTGNDISLTRKQSKEITKENRNVTDAQWRTMYRNAKQALRNNAGIRGKELRNAARAMTTGIMIEDPSIAIPLTQNSLNSNENITPARKFNEAVIYTGPLSETQESINNRRRINNEISSETTGKKSSIEDIPQSGTYTLDELKSLGRRASDVFMTKREAGENPNNWAQYQGEFWNAMNENNAFRPYSDLAAIQWWMKDDYERNWKPYDNTHPNYRWHLPTEAELAPYKNLTGTPAGTLTGDRSSWIEQGYNPNVNYFDFTNAKYGELGGSKKAYNQGAAATGAMILTPVVAGIASDVVAGGLPETTGYNPVGVQMKRPGVLGQSRLSNGQFGLNRQGSWYMDIYNGQRVPGFRVGGLKQGGKLTKDLK